MNRWEDATPTKEVEGEIAYCGPAEQPDLFLLGQHFRDLSPLASGFARPSRLHLQFAYSIFYELYR